MAAMLPTALLRADAEEVHLTAKGAAVEPAVLTPLQGALLTALQATTRARVTALLTRVGASSRAPLEALVEDGLARLSRRRRDRPPRTEVAAVMLPERPLDELLEACGRAPRQRQVVQWLAEQGRPALLSEVCTAVGCSPAVVRSLAAKGLVVRFTQARARRALWSLPGSDTRHQLTVEQQVAVDAVGSALTGGGYAPILLVGVTGSGKTEVYLRSLELCLAAGRSGLVLVPEIGLTPAASGAVERRFGDQVAVLHSAQSEGDRWREWRRVREGRVRIVVGPRSALFAPLDDLGLIVVDEEHDGAYKQEEAPRYHARDLALVLAQRLAVPALLCSATPSGEAFSLVERDLATRLDLTTRVAGGTLPEVELVDLRGEPPEPGEQGHTLFSRRLRETVAETLERNEQVILLMQRRGWAPVLLCRDCGHRVECPSCSVSLVVHRRSGDLRCHYCGFHRTVPDHCSECSGDLLDAVGAGTEKVNHHLQRLFPGVRAAILDRDTVRRRSGLEEVLGAFAAGEAQVLVGTQMVAKGHHFPRVTLTGVISADALLGLPDFRAGERTFQLLTQVAGRAGRGDRPGRVIIQTYYPEHAAVRHACQHDVDAFLAEEMVFRSAFHYPPSVRLALVRFEAATEVAARRAAEAAARAAEPLPDGVRLRGPAPAPLERLRGRWRWQVLLSARRRDRLRATLDAIETLKLPSASRRIVDVDPLSTL
jgi:primosomal protein N' (replication factor Y)